MPPAPAHDGPAISADASLEVEVEAEANASTGEGGSDAEPGAVDAAVGAPASELDTAALCTKASTCTTRVSMELCGLFDPKCLDSFHKHLDGATREKCQEKLDRLPALVEKHKRPGYVLPPECR